MAGRLRDLLAKAAATTPQRPGSARLPDFHQLTQSAPGPRQVDCITPQALTQRALAQQRQVLVLVIQNTHQIDETLLRRDGAVGEVGLFAVLRTLGALSVAIVSDRLGPDCLPTVVDMLKREAALIGPRINPFDPLLRRPSQAFGQG